jgi:hypothetical protein
MANPGKDGLFKTPRRAEDKWEMSNSVSRSMMEAEAAERRKKTARLRQARLEAEAEAGGEPVDQPVEEVPDRPRRTHVQKGKRSLAIKDES